MISIVSAVIGYVAGAFTPSIGRKIKSLFVKTSQKAETDVKIEASAVASDVASAVTKKL